MRRTRNYRLTGHDLSKVQDLWIDVAICRQHLRNVKKLGNVAVVTPRIQQTLDKLLPGRVKRTLAEAMEQHYVAEALCLESEWLQRRRTLYAKVYMRTMRPFVNPVT